MATIIVEDGTIVAGANSYASVAELATYMSDRGITLVGTPAVLLIKAMDYLESLSFIGVKRTSAQTLQWPRLDVVVDGYYIDATTLPTQLKPAQLAVACAIDAGNDPLNNIERAVLREKVDTLEVEYMPGSAPQTIVLTINAALSKLLKSAAGGNCFKVSRA